MLGLILLALLLLVPLAPTSSPTPHWEFRSSLDAKPQLGTVFYFDPDKNVPGFIWEELWDEGIPSSTWNMAEWRGTEWLTYTIPAPAIGMFPQEGVYDQQRHVLLVRAARFVSPGGIGWWEWDGNTWELSTSPPPILTSGSMVYDSCHDMTYSFKLSWSSGFNEVWRRDNMEWTLVDTIPEGVGEEWVVFDPTRCIFWFPDMWSWDGENWQQYLPAQTPPYLSQVAVMYDAVGRVVSPTGSATWEWDGQNWTLAEPMGFALLEG